MRARVISLSAALLALAIAPDVRAGSPAVDPRASIDVERDPPAPVEDEPTGPSLPTVELSGPRFGTAGQFVLTGAYGASLSQTTFQSGASYLDFGITPGIEWFVIDHLSIGVNASYRHVDDQGFFSDGSTARETGWSWSGGGRVGYDIPLGRLTSWYPRFSLDYAESAYDTRFIEFHQNPTRRPPTWTPYHVSSKGPAMELFAPLLLHVRNHVFIGFGPNISHSFANVDASTAAGSTGASTRVSASLVVGGYFGGRRDAEPAASTEVPQLEGRPARFGEDGTWVFSAESSLSGSYTIADRVSYWSGGIRVAPTVDYFVTDHVAVGASLLISNARSRTYDVPSGLASENVTTRLGGGVRVGLSGNLASWISIYPTAEFDLAHGEDGQDILGQGSDHGHALASFAGFAPLLFHLSQHFFVGVGPRVSADVINSRDGTDNKGAFIGVSALVGGWVKAPLGSAKKKNAG